jgi:hypothetical protein
MRRLVLAATLMLGACATTAPPAADIPIHGQTAGHTCRAAGTGQFVGQAATSETGSAIMRASGAAVLRWAPPGMMMTMDYREDRVTVRTGPDNRITQINCG